MRITGSLRWTAAAIVYSLFFVYVNAQTEPVSQICLGCICEAASGCNVTLGCDGDVCGPFRITWGYWADGGKPTLNNEPNNSPSAYSNCVNNPLCGAEAVKGYMNKYAQDCNRDGRIDCEDYLRIHRFGGYGCGNALNTEYEASFRRCMQQFG